MGETEQLDALAIGAHPDDVEITSGGLIIKMTKMGRRVGVLDMTQGETGTHGDENDRAREAQAAAKVMGLVYRHNLKLPDSGLMLTQENRLKVAQVIRDTKPELLILPHWEQRHPDHRVTTEIGYDACFLAGLKKADLDGEPHRPRKIIYASYFRNREYS
ncbi:MAG: bacillithiol biosynthesis deacetylase BshB1, partial [Candidatus Zixiibacteriota bacterium]